MYMQSYSTTADSEFSTVTSLYPVENGMAYSRYYKNTYDDIFKIFHQKDYTTSYMHGNYGYFWNRTNVYNNMEVDHVELKDTFADISVEAPLGSRTKLYLPDGTLVWLNAGSRMTYSQGFGVDNRKVELEGEGYFEVRRNEKLPFFVKTKDLQLQVLGTKFNVEGYSDKDDFEVTLMEGSVRVASRIGLGDTLMLKPDSKACLQKDGRLKVIPVDDYNPYRWKEGLICFRNESFLSIMSDLEKYFGVSIVVENKNVLKYYFTGKFRQADGIDYALRVLQRDIRFKYERDDENQIIYIR